MIKRLLCISLSAALCGAFLIGCGSKEKTKNDEESENSVITSDEFAEMVKDNKAVEGNKYEVSGTVFMVSSLDTPFVALDGDYFMKFEIADSDLEKLKNIENEHYNNSSKEISVIMSGEFKSSTTASDGNLNILFEKSIFEDIEGYEEPTYQDVTIGEIVIPAELKTKLSDKSDLSYVVDVSGKDSIQIFVNEMAENEIIWADDDMKNWVVSYKTIDGVQDYDISDQIINGYHLYTYSDSNGTSYVACRDYGSNKYSFVFRENWQESDCKDFLSKLINT